MARSTLRWRLTAGLALAELALCAALLVYAGAGEEGIRLVVRTTARVSLLLFSAAFAASSLQRLWPSATSAWLLRHRRYLGVAFAASQGLHLAALAGLAAVVPGFAAEPFVLVFGGLAYLFTAAMAATSSDAAVAWLGRRRWLALHTTGGWAILVVFAFDYSVLLFQSLFYAPLSALVASVIGVRAAVALRDRRGVAAPAPARH